MSLITITNGLYSNADNIVQGLAKKTGSRIMTDEEILELTHKTHDIKLTVLQKVVQSKPIAFNDFTHEKEKGLAFIKRTLSECASQGDLILHGLLGHLIPEEISHVLKVLIITDKKTRMTQGVEEHGLSESEAQKNIDLSDKYAMLWTNSLFKKKAWDPSLYDMVIASDKLRADESVDLISKNIEKLLFTEEDLIKKELEDFKLISEVEIALNHIGQGLSARAKEGHVTVTIDKKVLMLSSFQQKIVETVEKIPGVLSVETKIGKHYYKDTIVRQYEFETPLRILLVDDEKEFVHTLSERLKMRQFTSEIVYNGQEALDFTEAEDTQVMVLDLKMPGIDGVEVLKRIKQTQPDIEVIILTGHGTEKDKKTCLEMGAFAYLQKPADIDLLTETMKKAHAKILERENTPTA
ncbi:response regulator [Desulfospira joergensenii]|uniref:response regulator n=1 Tax=Desulfospira joergensenii TaxID=53329 RepID=UPI0003B4CE5A|nr:response regulator [Desulfospira joergensenii]